LLSQVGFITVHSAVSQLLSALMVATIVVSLSLTLSSAFLLRAVAFLHYTRSDPHRRSLRASRLRLPSRHHLPLRTLSALRPHIGGAAGGDSGRRALSVSLSETPHTEFQRLNISLLLL
jgi:hypothetical protein